MKKNLLQYFRTCIIIQCALCISHLSFAQAPSIQWQKSYGGTDDDFATSVSQTSDGGYIVTGDVYSINGDVVGNHGGTAHLDAWVLKLDNIGNIQWKKCLGGSDRDVLNAVQQTADGGYILAGGSRSNDGDVTGHHGTNTYTDYWVVKLDSTGGIQWQKSLGGSDKDEAWSIQQTIDLGYIVAGWSWSGDGDVIGNHAGAGDYWVVKLDSTGIIQWQKALGGMYGDAAWSVKQTADRGYIISGESNSIDGNVTGNHGFEDLWVVKLDSAGGIQWKKCFGGSQSEAGKTIQQTSDGGYIIAAWTQSTDGDVTGLHGFDFDYWIVKIDSAGGIQWQKSLGGSGSDGAWCVQQTFDGGYVVGGFSSSNDGDVTGHHGTTTLGDYWIVKLDANGNIQWQKSLGGTTDDESYFLQQTVDGGFILVGGAQSNDGDVTGHHGTNQYNDFWIVKLDNASGISQSNVISLALTISPNPFTTEIKISGTEKGEVILYDITGKEVLRQKTFERETMINTEKISSGFYLLHYSDSKRVENLKVMKVN